MRQRGVVALAVLLVACVAGGCGNGSESRAIELGDAYLQALTTAPDHGWSLLTGSRDAATDRDTYVAALDELDWSGFTYAAVGAHCDDGVCSVWYRISGGPAYIPGAYLGALYTDEKPEGANAVIGVEQRLLATGVTLPQAAFSGG